MKIGCLGSKDMVTLMKLAGVTRCEIGKENLQSQFDEMVKQVDLLIIEESYADKIKDKILYFRLLHDKPVIIEIPGKRKMEKEDTIRDIIRRAVGVDIGD